MNHVIHRLAALSALLLLAGAAQAHARISAPRDLTPRGKLVQGSDVAAAGGRSALLMESYRAAKPRPRDFSLYARLGNGTRLGAPQRLAGGSFGAQVAVGADGTAVAAWLAGTGHGSRVLRVALAGPRQPFGRVQTLSLARSLALGGVTVTPTGRALVAWSGGSGAPQVQVSIRRPGHRFGAPVTLGTSRQHAPAVTAAPDGTVAVAWLDTPSPPLPPPAPYVPRPALMLAASLDPGADMFGPPVQLGALRAWYSGPEAASGPGGAAVMWRQTDREKRIASIVHGGFEGAQSLPVPGVPSGDGHPDHLALAIPATGPPVALWHEVGGIGGDVFRVTSSVVVASVRRAGGAFGPPAQQSHSGVLAGQPQAAAGNDRVLAAWSESSRVPRVCIVLRRPDRLAGESRCPRAPGVATNTVDVAAANTYGLVTWIRRTRADETGGRVEVAAIRR